MLTYPRNYLPVLRRLILCLNANSAPNSVAIAAELKANEV
jgi:hypothetical protein